MSFEMKYNKDGDPIVPKTAAVVTEAPASEVQEPQIEEQVEQQEVEQEVSYSAEATKDRQAQPEVQQQISREEAKRIAHEQSREKNVRLFREQAERAERERDELMRKLQQIEAQKSAAPEEDLDINLGSDDIAEGKHLSKIDKKIKKLESLIKQQNQYTAEMTAEARLKAQYPDFDRIVSKENLETLQYTEPELFQVVKQSPDLYGQAVTAYKLIKKLGITQEPVDPYVKDREIIQKNSAKPRPLTSISPQQGSSPLQQANVFANGLTPELQEQLRKEMFAARKAM